MILDFEKYLAVQNSAKSTMDYCCSIICAGMNLIELRERLERHMFDEVDSFWYHGIGAFIFAGSNTIKSVSGRDYVTDDYQIKENDIITVDLSPQKNGYWGDFARTIIVEDGLVKSDINSITNTEWQDGLAFQTQLHNLLCNITTPDMTFDYLFHIINNKIVGDGYVNLDFKKNLGHSIEKGKERIYIEIDNHIKLGSVQFFTFEPHISRRGGQFGIKQENIYYFDCGKLMVL